MIYESINIPLWRALKGLAGRTVLDVGCGTGALGEQLEKGGNRVTGITRSGAEALIASTRITAVRTLDLEDGPALEAALAPSYDVMLFADVLEHLRDPAATLGLLLKRLGPGGMVCVSLPNIACFTTRFGLLFGRFNMSAGGGILDETHLHFYTLRSARELLTGAGLRIERVDFVPAPSVWVYQAFLKGTAARDAVPRAMAGRGSFQFYQKWLYPIEHAAASWWRTMFANQFVFVCRRAADAPAGPGAA